MIASKTATSFQRLATRVCVRISVRAAFKVPEKGSRRDWVQRLRAFGSKNQAVMSSLSDSRCGDVGALIIRIGFWGFLVALIA